MKDVVLVFLACSIHGSLLQCAPTMRQATAFLHLNIMYITKTMRYLSTIHPFVETFLFSESNSEQYSIDLGSVFLSRLPNLAPTFCRSSLATCIISVGKSASGP